MVMPSLQRPRRISLRGDDGKSYLFMCKPKDDLRRDFRLMEFNDIVNNYLQKDPESRRRRLYIRTYVSRAEYLKSNIYHKFFFFSLKVVVIFKFL